MKRKYARPFLLLLLIALLAAAHPAQARTPLPAWIILDGAGGSAAAPAAAAGPGPRNVIVMVGDGMGFEHVKAAGMALYGEAGTLSFEQFAHQGQVITARAGGGVTDSAAAATALAAGQKVANTVVSVADPGDGRALPTLLEEAAQQGKATGLVTTSYLTDATPAAFAAHEPTRTNHDQIAADYLYETRPNVLLGGGGEGLSPEAALAAGYRVVTDREAMNELDTEAQTGLAGLFGSDHMPYELDGLGSYPHLTEMTRTALAVLDNDPDGLFLVVEGGLIDVAAHQNDLPRVVEETVEFHRAVEAAMAWAEGRADTLIVVIADHETGGLQVLENRGAGQLPLAAWGSGSHTGANVPIYAAGAGAEQVWGILDNTELRRVIYGLRGPAPFARR